MKTLGTLGCVALSLLGAGHVAAAQDASRAATARDNAPARAACPASCDDGNPCTVDSCDRHGRCRNVDLARCNNPHAATLPLPGGSYCTAITSCSIPDSDGDGLNDAWEIQGGVDLNCDGEIDRVHDLLLPGADPLRKDVYLEYAYMVLPDEGTACAETAECSAGQSCREGICRGHSHRPHRQAIRAVVDAFERKGIALHVDRGEALPHNAVVTYDPVDASCAGDDAVNFYDLKAAHSDPKRKTAYHYAVFGHYNTCGSPEHCATCAGNIGFAGGGRAELPGNDLLVSTGQFFELGIDPFVASEAGLFMHELGHNFGLRHGGDVDLPDYKPNLLSVVNDTFVYTGIPVAETPGSTTPQSCRRTAECPEGAVCSPDSHTCFRIDYSSEALPSLDEQHLDENVGIAGGSNDLTGFQCPDFAESYGAATGPIDWNCNADPTEPDIVADVNADGYPNDRPWPWPWPDPYRRTTTLTGYADWPNMKFAFQCTAAGSANAPPPPETLSSEELSIHEAARKHILLPRRSVEVEVQREKAGQAAIQGQSQELVVTVLGADDLDVGSIERSSLKLAGASPLRLEERDVNGDGRPDLVATFDMSRLKLHPRAEAARLTGWLKNSQAFVASVPR